MKTGSHCRVRSLSIKRSLQLAIVALTIAFEEVRLGLFQFAWENSRIVKKPRPAVNDSFHASVHDQIKNLVIESTIISWDGYIDSKNLQEMEIRPALAALDIVRIHNLSRQEKRKVWRSTSHNPVVWTENICSALRGFRAAGNVKKHVLFTYLNENRGAFSKDVPNRTVLWDSRLTNWEPFGCTDEEVFDYLNNENTLAVFSTQHQSYGHPKIHSIPLGVKWVSKEDLLRHLRMPLKERTQLLMINDNGWKHRTGITETVMANFEDIQLKNTYNRSYTNMDAYLDEMQQSKFVLAPSGLGIDCYRIWEALYMGTIPIVERYGRPVDGWRRTLDDLPVLWVEHYSDVTPELLEKAYLEIAANASRYNYKKLTIPWWVDFIRSFLQDVDPD